MHTRKEELSALEMLTARSDFLAVQSSGVKWVSRGLILQIRDNDSLKETGKMRIGYTVSKRTSKSAVTRNRIKRRLRAVAADVLPHYARAGVDYVLVGRPLTEDRDYQTLCGDLKWCLRKTGYALPKKKQEAPAS